MTVEFDGGNRVGAGCVSEPANDACGDGGLISGSAPTMYWALLKYVEETFTIRDDYQKI